MAALVLYANGNETATITNTFLVDGVATDPGEVTVVVTAPDGTPTTYTYGGGTVEKTGTGAYRKEVAVPTSGLWSAVIIGTTPAADVVAVSWEVQSTETRRLYVSLELLKASLKITDTTRDALLITKLTAAARGVDAYCRRPHGFWLDGTASARVYRPDGRLVHDRDGERLLVDDIGSTSGLVVETSTDGTTWSTVAASEYETAPDNALADGYPVTSIRRLMASWTAGNRRGRIRVTARWGWPSVPSVVAEATLLQATRLYMRKDSPEGIAGGEAWGGIRVARVDPDVAALLADVDGMVIG